MRSALSEDGVAAPNRFFHRVAGSEEHLDLITCLPYPYGGFGGGGGFSLKALKHAEVLGAGLSRFWGEQGIFKRGFLS